jgi:Domain of unknown function (DUF4783)
MWFCKTTMYKQTKHTIKHHFLAILVMVLGINIAAQTASAQTADEVLNAVEASIRKGDAGALSAHLHTTVEVTIGDKDEVYSANQAKFVIEEFFMKNPVRSFTLMHRGSSGDTYYAVGAYVNGSGVSYDTNIFLKKVGSRYVVEQIRFETDI